MLDRLKAFLGGGPGPTIEQLARGMDSVGLPMAARPEAIATAEQESGAPVPTRIVAFLREFPAQGVQWLDPEGHARHSDALARLLASIEAELTPFGAIGPGAEDLAAGRNWWYCMFQAREGVERDVTWDGFLAVRLASGEEAIAEAEERYAIALPSSYRRLLCVFDQVLHSALHCHEGIIGPLAGAGLQSFEGELGYLREWFDAAGHYAETPREEIENYLPFYADPYGDKYLFARQDPGAVHKFDHELCAIAPTRYADFDAFVAALLSGQLE